MTNAPLFAVARADRTILLTPQRDLSEFEFIQMESEAAEILGRISKGGGPNVVVDFSKIAFCGSTALGFFTQLHKAAENRGGEMAMCNLSMDEREVMRVTRLDTLWTVCDNLEEALESVCARDTAHSQATWIVVADRAMARIFEQGSATESPLRSIATLRHPESREKMSKIVTDGAGSFRGGGITGAEAGDPGQDHRHQTAHAFARQIATWLDVRRDRGEFGRLTLIAAPLFLGTLRECLSAPLRRLVESETARDYTHLSGDQIYEHIRELAESV